MSMPLRSLAQRGRVLHEPLLRLAAGLSAAGGIVQARRRLSTVRESGVILPKAGIIRPKEAGIIYPEPVRGLCSVPMTQKPLLPQPQPVITQTSCPHQDDNTLFDRRDVCSFFKQNPAAKHVQGTLFGELDQKTLMMTPGGRSFWKSAVDLVAMNRRRGFCIANQLVYDNVIAFAKYGTIGLKSPGADNILGSNPASFKGYIALKDLFIEVMSRLHGPKVMNELSDDVGLWTDSLERAALGKDQEDQALQHAALMGLQGRAWLTIRVGTVLKCEMAGQRKYANFVQHVYEALDELGDHLSERHPFFHEWRSHAEKVGERMGSNREQPILEPEDDELFKKVANGYWIVSIFRHAMLHPYSSGLTMVSPVGRSYDISDVIDLLHYKSSTYLPVIQALFLPENRWRFLHMESCWPKVLI